MQPRATGERTTLLTSTASVSLADWELLVDPALPGFEFLCEPAQLRAMLAPAVSQRFGPERHLVDARAYLRRLFPGKRCSVELELVFDRADGVSECHRMLGKLYRDDQAVTVYDTLVQLRRHGLGTG